MSVIQTTLPTEWQLKRIDEISLVNPRRPSKQIEDNHLVSFIPMAAVDDKLGKILKPEEKAYKEVKRGYTYFEENDVLFAKITPCMENGKAAVAKNLISGFGYGTTEFHVIRCSESVVPEWVFYFIRQIGFRRDAKKAFRGAVGQQRVPADFVSSYMIPIPYPHDTEKSLQEQRRIVAHIESLFTEVERAKKLHASIVQDTEQLMDAVLNELIPNPYSSEQNGFSFYPLNELTTEANRQIKPGETPDKEFNYWGLDAINAGEFFEPVKNIVRGSEIASTCISFVPGQVLYCKLRPYLNKVISTTKEGIGSTEWVVLQPETAKVLPEYLANVMRSQWFVNTIMRSTTGARMPRARKSVLREMLIPVPNILGTEESIDIQKQIVLSIETMYQQMGSLKKILAIQQKEFERLQQSILSQAFKGEL